MCHVGLCVLCLNYYFVLLFLIQAAHVANIVVYIYIWRSHGRSFRIRHEKSPEAPPSGEITMTSYKAFNKTSLSRKLCIPDKKLTMERYQEVVVALSESDMQKSPGAPPGG